MPIPDRVALNGPMAWDAYVGAGYPVRQLVKVEAIRFQYLERFRSREPPRCDGIPASADVAEEPPRKLLILGDFTAVQTLKMLRCLTEACRLLDVGFGFLCTLKPHPACPIGPADWTEMHLEWTYEPLTDIVEGFDVVFSSNTTSAGLDAYLAGLAIIIYLDSTHFNYSPLRGLSGVRFASTPRELAQGLRAAERKTPCPVPDDFFWLDARLPRWRQLLLPGSEARQAAA